MSAPHYSLNTHMPLLLVRIQHLKLHSFKGLQEGQYSAESYAETQSTQTEFRSLNYKYIYQKSFYF